MSSGRRLRRTAARIRNERERVLSRVDDSDGQCVICLKQRETMRARGRIPPCRHLFCFECIMEWSRVTNTCPVCKQKFRVVTEVSLQGAFSPKKHFIRLCALEASQSQEGATQAVNGSLDSDDLDEYDLEDPFIDDTDNNTQARDSASALLAAVVGAMNRRGRHLERSTASAARASAAGRQTSSRARNAAFAEMSAPGRRHQQQPSRQLSAPSTSEAASASRAAANPGQGRTTTHRRRRLVAKNESPPSSPEVVEIAADSTLRSRHWNPIRRHLADCLSDDDNDGDSALLSHSPTTGGEQGLPMQSPQSSELFPPQQSSEEVTVVHETPQRSDSGTAAQSSFPDSMASMTSAASDEQLNSKSPGDLFRSPSGPGPSGVSEPSHRDSEMSTTSSAPSVKTRERHNRRDANALFIAPAAMSCRLEHCASAAGTILSLQSSGTSLPSYGLLRDGRQSQAQPAQAEQSIESSDQRGKLPVIERKPSSCGHDHQAVGSGTQNSRQTVRDDALQRQKLAGVFRPEKQLHEQQAEPDPSGEDERTVIPETPVLRIKRRKTLVTHGNTSSPVQEQASARQDSSNPSLFGASDSANSDDSASSLNPGDHICNHSDSPGLSFSPSNSRSCRRSLHRQPLFQLSPSRANSRRVLSATRQPPAEPNQEPPEHADVTWIDMSRDRSGYPRSNSQA